MNEKELREIKRTLDPEKTAVNTIYGCYVNGEGRIISRFKRSLGMIQREEGEKYLNVFRKTISGTIGKTLVDIPFDTNAVQNSDEHKLLTLLKDTCLEDENALDTLYNKIIASSGIKENYVILVTCNKYDVPYKTHDGDKSGDSEEVFTYVICGICPVKMSKSALAYDAEEKTFKNLNGDGVVTSPVLGFMFPSFDNRQTNIYNALMLTKDTGDAHEGFTTSVFGRGMAMMPADEQKNTFRSVMCESLENDCSLDVAKEVRRQLNERIEAHRQSKDPENLVISKNQVKGILESCGVPEEKLESFAENYSESFGSATDLPPKNIMETKKFELRTPDVVIKVAPDKTDLVETRVIDGVKYVLIRAEDGVELNGLPVTIN